MYREIIDQFAVEVNAAIQQGTVPPKSKIPELIPRVATALHVFNHTMEGLLAGVPASLPPTEISKATLECAAEFVHHLEGQKGILCQVSSFHFKMSKQFRNVGCSDWVQGPAFERVNCRFSEVSLTFLKYSQSRRQPQLPVDQLRSPFLIALVCTRGGWQSTFGRPDHGHGPFSR